MDIDLDAYFRRRSFNDKVRVFEGELKPVAKQSFSESKPIVTQLVSESKPIVTQSLGEPLTRIPSVIPTKHQNDNVAKISVKLKALVDMHHKQPGLLPETYKHVAIDFSKNYTAKELVDIWMKTYNNFVMYVYYDMGLKGQFRDISGYVHRSATALILMPMYNHHIRLALIGMLDLIQHADIHIRHKHKEILKLGMAMDIVERIIPDFVSTLVKLGFDPRVINMAMDIVELLKRLINLAEYREL